MDLSEEADEDYPRKAERHRGGIGQARRDRRSRHGSARLAESAIAKDKGIDKKAVTPEMMFEFKEIVMRVLTPHASAILLDPEYGLPAAKARSKNAGLILAYEKTGYDATHARPSADLLDHLVRAPPRGRRRRLRKDLPVLHALRSRPTSTKPSTPGSSASAPNARLWTSRFSSNSSATRRASTKRELNTPARSPKSSPAAWKSSPSPSTAWTS